MIVDQRLSYLAKHLVEHSVAIRPGESVLINATDTPYQFVNLIVREVFAAGGYPFVNIVEPRMERLIRERGDGELFRRMARYTEALIEDMDAIITVSSPDNYYEMVGLDKGQSRAYGESFAAVSEKRRKKRWVSLRYPNTGLCALVRRDSESFEEYFFEICCIDYRKFNELMTPLADLIARTDKVRITGKGTDLTFSVKGIGAVKCSGEKNIPDGEVYTAPVKESVNGVITYNIPSRRGNVTYRDVRLVFENGRIVEATANETDLLNQILDLDEGARYVGEFSIGLNPFVYKITGEPLFDEKTWGSIHFTPGNSYEDADNGNRSRLHWDLVLYQGEEGGGEIWFDDVLIRKDGAFVLPELEGLNLIPLYEALRLKE